MFSIFFFFFFCPQKIEKKHPQKLLIIGPNLLFHSPAQPTAQNWFFICIIKCREQASVLLSVISARCFKFPTHGLNIIFVILICFHLTNFGLGKFKRLLKTKFLMERSLSKVQKLNTYCNLTRKFIFISFFVFRRQPADFFFSK